MEFFLHSLGTDIWIAVVNGYKVLNTPPIDVFDQQLYECNARSKNAILLSSLADLEFTKVMQVISTKDIWDKLQSIYKEMS